MDSTTRPGKRLEGTPMKRYLLLLAALVALGALVLGVAVARAEDEGGGTVNPPACQDNQGDNNDDQGEDVQGEDANDVGENEEGTNEADDMEGTEADDDIDGNEGDDQVEA